MHIRTAARSAVPADDDTQRNVAGTAVDRGNSGSASGVRMSPDALQLSSLERGVAAGGGVGSGADSPRSACRPSPQLMAALQHGHSEAGRPPATSSASHSAANRSPPLANLAGLMPPGLKLERSAIMTPPPADSGNSSGAAPARQGTATAVTVPASAHSPVFYTSQWPPRSAHQSPKLHAQLHQTRSMSPTTTSSGPSTPPNPQDQLQQQQSRGRSWSMGPGPTGRSPRTVRTFASNMTPPFGAVAIRRQMLGRQSFDGLHMLQLHRAAGLSLPTDGAGDEDAENQQLLPSARVLRNRSHSMGVGAPLVSAPMLSEPMGGAWSSKGSRVAIYCASAVLFVLIFCFFLVVALRLAAHAKYDNGACVLRNQERAREQAGGAASYRPPGVKIEQNRWVPEYRWDRWDRPAFLKNLKEKWTREANAEREMAKLEGPDSTAAAAAAAVAVPTGADLHARAAEVFDAGAWLSLLRLNHFKVMGTHNSYHLPSSLPLSMHQYAHAPIPVQLDSYRKGVRQLELDVHLSSNRKSEEPAASGGAGSSASGSGSGAPDADDGGFLVYHLQWVDDRTSCYCLSECLEALDGWSRAHPLHFPVYLAFEIKSQLWEDVDTGLRGVSCADVEGVEREILSVLPRSRLVLPVQVQGGPNSPYKTVKAALHAAADEEVAFAADLDARLRASQLPGAPPLEAPKPQDYPSHAYGWPRLTDALGKIVVIWLDDMHSLADRLDCLQPPATTTQNAAATAATAAAAPTAEATGVDAAASGTGADAAPPSPSPSDWFHDPSRIFFIAQNSLDAPYASVVTAKHPLAAMRTGVVRGAMERGMLVRTMTDESVDLLPDRARFAAALHSGAHMLTTDFEECVERTQFHEEEPPAAAVPATGGADGPVTEPIRRALPPQSHVHGDSHLPFVLDAPALLASSPLALAAAANASSNIYCEHLPSEWPFECNQLTAPFFCEAAMYALRVQYEFPRKHPK